MYDIEDHNNLTHFYTYQKKASLTSFMHHQYMNLYKYHYFLGPHLSFKKFAHVKAPIMKCSAQSCTRKDSHGYLAQILGIAQ